MTTKATEEPAEAGGETPVETAALYDLFDAAVAMDRLTLADRLRVGSERSRALTSRGQGLMRRQLDGADGRSGQVLGPDGSSQSVLNFGSIDYLRLYHHPTVVEQLPARRCASRCAPRAARCSTDPRRCTASSTRSDSRISRAQKRRWCSPAGTPPMSG